MRGAAVGVVAFSVVEAAAISWALARQPAAGKNGNANSVVDSAVMPIAAGKPNFFT